MHTNSLRTFLALHSAVLMIVLTPSTAMGAESSSFRLYENTDTADASPLQSGSFSLNEGGDTWVQFPVTSNNFQIVTSPPAQQQEEPSGGGGDTGEGGGGSDVSSGGGRGGSGASPNAPRNPPVSKPQQPTESESPEVTIPKQPDETIEDVPLDANIIDEEPFAPSAPVGPSEGDFVPGYGVVTAPLTEQEQYQNVQCGCICPTCRVQEEVRCAAADRVIKIPVPIFTEDPLPSMLLLLAAFGAGYLGKAFRPGYASVSTKAKKRPSKKKK